MAALHEGPIYDVTVESGTLVVDGVDDGSVALLEAESRFALRSIIFPENRGRVAALNAGFEAARGGVLSIGEIANAAGVPLPTTHRLLRTLVDRLGLPEVVVSEADILDGIAWSAAR